MRTGLTLPKLLAAALALSAFIFSAETNVSAQNKQAKGIYINKPGSSGFSFDENELRTKMKKDGIADEVINTLIKQRKEFDLKQQEAVKNLKQITNPPVVNAACSDMGGEAGWGAWTGIVGTHNATGPPVFGAQPWPTPAAPNFSITSGGGIDPCTPAATPPGAPMIPVVAPGFGSSSLLIGVPQATGCVAEEMTYPLTVTANDTNFLFSYAMIIQDAGHSTGEQPYVEICIRDQAGNQVPCGCFRYTGGPNLPGFYTATCGFNTYYKPWTIVGVNLSNYVGQTVNITITNVDCAQCGHFAHSYWDFSCGTISGTAANYCPGQPSSLCAPVDPMINYTYTWTQNGQPYTGLPSATAQCITPIPVPGDTFVVDVAQPSGCNFQLVYVPQPFSITPDYTYTGTCGQMTFTDISTTSSPTIPITGWNWSFPGGNPASSTSQNPGIITYPAGTYTATLIVSTAQGCADTIKHTFSVGGFPTAAFTSTPPCLGQSLSLTDGSVGLSGDPIVSWSWSMPGGNPASSTSTNTATTYNTAGTHSVTLVVTSQTGCKDTIIQQVLVYNPPIANLSGSGTGCAPVCVTNYTDLSTSVDGNIVSWNWSFPGGSPSSYSGQTPPQICYSTPGQYGASLTVATQYGCTHSVSITPLVTVYAWPSAEFCVVPDKAPVTDPVFAFCDLWSTDVVSWTWSFGDGDSNVVSTDPTHSYSAAVSGNDFYSFNICLEVKNQYGCWDTICHVVELIPEFEFYIPNSFTPNGDFMNEYFFGKCRGVKEYDIWVFDRWGNNLWYCHKEDKNTNWDNQGQDGLSSACKWDGKVVPGGMDMSGHSKQLSEEDVYVWKVKLIDVFDKKHTYVGHVSIVH